MSMLPRRKSTWVILVGAAILVVAALLVLAHHVGELRCASCTLLDARRGSRIRYEPGAENLARAVAVALPAAVARVEECSQRRSRRPSGVRLCVARELHLTYWGAGQFTRPWIAFLRDIWVSPTAFAFHGKTHTVRL